MLSRVDKLSTPVAKQFMRDIYETNFGIFNHVSGPEKYRRPLASVALHYPESNSGVRNVGELIEYYINMDVNKHVGVTLSEFLAMPRHLVRKIMQAVDRKTNEQMKATAAALSESGKIGRM